MKKMLRKIHKVSLREQAINAIRNVMIEGKFKPGEKISENDLAEQLGISRTPIREAIRILELQGLVKTIPKSGTYVAEVNTEEIQDRLNVRIGVEQMAIMQAFERSSQGQWDELCKNLAIILNKMEKAITRGDIVGATELDIDWHTHIIDAGQNRYLSWLWRTSGMQYLIWSPERSIYPFEKDKWIEITVSRHEDLLNVLMRKNLEECCQAIRSHIEIKYNDLNLPIVERSFTFHPRTGRDQR